MLKMSTLTFPSAEMKKQPLIFQGQETFEDIVNTKSNRVATISKDGRTECHMLRLHVIGEASCDWNTWNMSIDHRPDDDQPVKIGCGTLVKVCELQLYETPTFLCTIGSVQQTISFKCNVNDERRMFPTVEQRWTSFLVVENLPAVLVVVMTAAQNNFHIW